MSILQSELEEHSIQLQKLAALIDQLESRLAPVLAHGGLASDGKADELPPSSPVVNQVRTHTSIIKAFQGSVQRLISDLEV